MTQAKRFTKTMESIWRKPCTFPGHEQVDDAINVLLTATAARVIGQYAEKGELFDLWLFPDKSSVFVGLDGKSILEKSEEMK